MLYKINIIQILCDVTSKEEAKRNRRKKVNNEKMKLKSKSAQRSTHWNGNALFFNHLFFLLLLNNGTGAPQLCYLFPFGANKKVKRRLFFFFSCNFFAFIIYLMLMSAKNELCQWMRIRRKIYSLNNSKSFPAEKHIIMYSEKNVFDHLCLLYHFCISHFTFSVPFHHFDCRVTKWK